MTTGPEREPLHIGHSKNTCGRKEEWKEGRKRREGGTEGREGRKKERPSGEPSLEALPITLTAPAHPASSFIFTCTTSEQPTLTLHLSSREGSAPVMRDLSSIPEVLSPTHGHPSDEPGNKRLPRCCWPQLLQGTPHQPSGTAQMGWRWGFQQALFQGAVAQDSGLFFFFSI